MVFGLFKSKKNRRKNDLRGIKQIIAVAILIIGGTILFLSTAKEKKIQIKETNQYDIVFNLMPKEYKSPEIKEAIEKRLNKFESKDKEQQCFEAWRNAQNKMADLEIIVEDGTNLEKFIPLAKKIIAEAKISNDNEFLAEISQRLIDIAYTFPNSDEFNPEMIM